MQRHQAKYVKDGPCGMGTYATKAYIRRKVKRIGLSGKVPMQCVKCSLTALRKAYKGLVTKPQRLNYWQAAFQFFTRSSQIYISVHMSH